MAGLDTRQKHGGHDELVGHRSVLLRIQRLTLVLLLLVVGLAAFHPAAATARQVSSATDPMAAERPGRPFATSSGQHGIENRDPAPQAPERRTARGVDSFAAQAHRSEQSLPAERTRLQRPVHGGPPSRADGGHSPRAPPQAAGVIQPLA